MSELYKNHQDPQALREKMIGLGESSFRKSYYPQLCQRIDELEDSRTRLEENGQALMRALESLREEQRKTQQSEHTFQTLFEQITDGVLLLDYETKHLSLGNRAIQRMLNCAAEELPGLSVFDIHPTEEYSQIEHNFFAGWHLGEQRMFTDVPVLRRDGTIFYAEINTTLIEMQGRRYLMGVFRDITARQQAEAALEAAHLETVLALARAVDARDAYTGNHSQDMAGWAVQVARAMDCSPEELQTIHWSALLHDIGKIGVPDEILKKATALTPAEWQVMKLHPETASAILGPIKRLKGVAEVVRAHHERWDGAGYPDGLAGQDIPLGARIIAVVDAYGAIIDERVYRKARTPAEAVAELKACAGKQFDPRVVDVFVEILAS